MVSSLRLMNFRCFDRLELEIPESGAVIVGSNAQGKTSILEAICVIVRLQSPRSSRMGRMVQINSASFGIAGECWGVDRQVRYCSRQGVEMKLDDESVVKQGDYLRDGGLVVWMGNDDLELVRGSGKVRRRYLDFLGCQLDPEYRDHLNRYNRVLKARNLLLKDRVHREAEISAYTELLITHGNYLTKVRGGLVVMLDPATSAAQSHVSSCDERVGMDYISGSGDDFKISLNMTAERERRIGQTLAGPHRDELRLTINGMAAVDFASEGQQRTMALSLKLAQGDLLYRKAGKMPVYLLDDIFGELDPNRRNALMKALPTGAQKIITTTNIDWMEDGFAVIEMGGLRANES